MSQPWRKLGPHFVSLNFLQLLYCRETSSSDAAGLLRAVTKVSSESGSKSPGGHSVALLSLGLMAPAAKSQTTIILPSGFSGATGHITLESPLVHGSIHLISGQGGWTC
jgi:hypothetical protein